MANRRKHVVVGVPTRPQDPLHELLGITGFLMKHEISANTVTVIRGLLILPVIVLTGFGFNEIAFLLHLISWWGDAIDGSIARERERCGYVDNKDLGEYLDPMVDKASWVAEVLFLPFATHLATAPTWVVTVAIVAMCVLVSIEGALAIVRWQDYRNNTAIALSTESTRLKLVAQWSGKVKLVLEVIGLSALLLVTPTAHVWIYHLWAWALVAAMPLAALSLLQKLWGRKTI